MTTSLTIDNVEYFTAVGAARELGCTQWAIKKAVERGQLTASDRLGNYNLFSRTEVERYRREHRKPRKQIAEKVSV
jgi:hypothetical protein